MAESDERHLAGSSGDDVSAGTSVSGVGGEAMDTTGEDAGLRPVHEGGAELGWGKDAARAGEQLTGGNDGTGQSEKPQSETPQSETPQSEQSEPE